MALKGKSSHDLGFLCCPTSISKLTVLYKVFNQREIRCTVTSEHLGLMEFELNTVKFIKLPWFHNSTSCVPVCMTVAGGTIKLLLHDTAVTQAVLRKQTCSVLPYMKRALSMLHTAIPQGLVSVPTNTSPKCLFFMVIGKTGKTK